ncbi:MAG: aminodeoxychorismate synthase component I [Gammaproteobacteria bacterium]|nr:aminodeoxychorismate synthase component I [Gammaproteobacteria bacterium]
MNRIELPLDYQSDPAIYFEHLLGEPWPIWLDSGHTKGSRYDILVARPYKTLVTRGAITTISDRNGTSTSHQAPLKILSEQLRIDGLTENRQPFSGGAVGYFGYGLNTKRDAEHKDDSIVPDMAIGLYSCAVIIDHQLKTAHLSGLFDDETDGRRELKSLQALLEQPSSQSRPAPSFGIDGPFSESLNRQQYRDAFSKIQHYLQEGDCYQVNLTQRFSAPCHGDLWGLYQAIRKRNPAPYGAFMQLDDVDVLSFSPEQFLKLSQRQVTTSPIKGTRPRNPDPQLDQLALSELRNSEKERAENLMIVDLLRNDLGRCCRTGSIKVPKLFFTESHPTVHHLVSTITGELAANKTAIDLLHDCFPGGSITGAPKIRAMEIIDEVEPVKRHIYCGSIGYIGFDGSMETNIAIRTAYHHNGEISFHAGGGIITDSNVESEYQELFDKAGFFLNYFQNPIEE